MTLLKTRSKRPLSLPERICCLAVCFFSCSAVAATIEYSLDSAEATVDSLHRGLVEVAGDDAMDSAEERFDSLLPLVQATHDIEYIAELSVRRNWGSFDADQQARFVAAFGRLSAMTYAVRFENVNEETFERVGSEETTGERVHVYALISRDRDEDVTLDYLLQRNESGWQIINIVADGVSDLALKRSEYRGVLSDGSVEDLIRYVEDQSDDLLEGARQ